MKSETLTSRIADRFAAAERAIRRLPKSLRRLVAQARAEHDRRTRNAR
jgi:hypothetical protein